MVKTQSAQVAKEIRVALKEAFPNVKFSVRTHNYSGGSSINVSWENFPIVSTVEEVINQYKNVRYDESTGEILSGGNRFVFCSNEWTQEVREQIESLVPDCFDKNDYNYYHWFNKAAEEMYNKLSAKSKVVEIEESEEVETVETVQEEQEQQKDTANDSTHTDAIEISVSYSMNEQLNGLEVVFSDKPEQAVIDALNANGFRYHRRGKYWYAKQTTERIEFAKGLCGESEAIADSKTIITCPDVDIEDIHTYVVDSKLQETEHNSNWIFRTQKIDRTKEIQDHFVQVNEKVKAVLTETDNERIIYSLKLALRRYKKKYYDNYLTQLRNKAYNPHIAVTGRSGRNMNQLNKANSRYDRLIGESVELTNWINGKIDKARREIRQEQEATMRDKMSKTNLSIVFQVEQKEITVGGLREKVRTYNYDGYMIAKSWGCFRIFYNEKEIYAMKSVDKLEDAKRYVAMLVQEQDIAS